MTRIVIQFEDISQEKQEEIYDALRKEDLSVEVLSDTHEFYIECAIDQDEITFE